MSRVFVAPASSRPSRGQNEERRQDARATNLGVRQPGCRFCGVRQGESAKAGAGLPHSKNVGAPTFPFWESASFVLPRVTGSEVSV